jgi:antirestriction protein
MRHESIEKAKRLVLEARVLLSAGRSEPQVYIADLGAYVGGRLKGEWITPASDADDLQEQIDKIVGKGEEWAVHDYDGFPDMGEYPGVKALADMAEILEEHDLAIVEAAMGEGYTETKKLAEFLSEGYEEHKSVEDYAASYIDDIGGLDELDDATLLRHIDVKSLARDMEIKLSPTEVGRKIYIFYR